MDTFLFTIASKKLKYPGINLTKEMKNLYSEHFKPLKKKIKTLENGKTVLAHELVDNDHFTKNYLQIQFNKNPHFIIHRNRKILQFI